MPEALPGEVHSPPAARAWRSRATETPGSEPAAGGSSAAATEVEPGQSTPSPIQTGNSSSGIFSLTFWDADHGVAVGGDFKEPDRTGRNCALSSDGGRTWRLPLGSGPTAYRSAVTRVPDSKGPTLLAVGPTGTDQSEDGGENWTKLAGDGFHAIVMTKPHAGWAVGEHGRIARYDFHSKINRSP